MSLNWRFERCPFLFELTEGEFHFFDLSIHSGQLICGFHEKSTYLQYFDI
jgi:hypothetical protein